MAALSHMMILFFAGALLFTFTEAYSEDESFDEMMVTMDKISKENGIACPADVLFVLDATGSMRDVYDNCLQYVIKVLEGLTISADQDRVGVVLYSSPLRKRVKIPLGSINDSVSLVKAVKALPFLSGITATGAALQLAEVALQARRPDVQTHVVVITDGFSYDAVEDWAIKLRHLPNTHVYAVALSSIYYREGLELIAGSSDAVLFGPSSYGTLVRWIKECKKGNDKTADGQGLLPVETATVHFMDMATDGSGRHLVPVAHYTVEEGDSSREFSGEEAEDYEEASGLLTPEDPEGTFVATKDGSNSSSPYLQVSNNVESFIVIQEGENISGSGLGEYVPADAEGSAVYNEDGSGNNENVQQTELEPVILPSDQGELHTGSLSASPSCRYDVVFVFDASGSLEGVFEDQLEVANRLIEHFVLGPDNTQVAAIKYAGKGKCRLIFNFKDVTTKAEAKRLIAGMGFMRGTTYTNEALMRTADLFSGAGARPGKAQPIAIVFTDGFSGEDPSEGAHILRKMGVMVFAIALDKGGKAVNRNELELIAGHPSRVYTLSNIADFEEDLSKSSQNCLRTKVARLK